MTRILALPVALVLLVQAVAAADPRPPLRGVSAIRAGNYGAPSVLLEDRQKVGPIIEELNALRSKPWRRGETRLSCYATVVLLGGKRTLATLRVRPDLVVERSGAKGQASYSIAIGQSDLPGLTTLLSEIAPAQGCK